MVTGDWLKSIQHMDDFKICNRHLFFYHNLDLEVSFTNQVLDISFWLNINDRVIGQKEDH